MHVMVAGTLAAVLAGAQPQIEAGDVVAGYRQNFAEFRTLHVEWQRVLVNTENYFEQLELLAQNAEQASTREEVGAEERARLVSQAASYRGTARAPQNVAPAAFKQGFWTDRTGFQMRLASPQLAEQKATWRPPTGSPRIDSTALLNDYKDTMVICFSGRTEEGFRIWQARAKENIHMASIQKAPPDSDETHFPALGFVNAEWGSHWHPFDEFFAGPIEQLHVVREEEFAGHRTYVVERVVENPRKELKLKPEHLKKYGEEVQVFDVTRVWVDPARGFIPLKLEWDAYTTYRGKPVAPVKKKGPSFRSIGDVELRKVSGTAGYYPVRCTMRMYALEASYRGPFVTVGDFIEGRPQVDVPVRLHQECRWEVSTVEGNRDMSGLLSLPFPDNTSYYDARQSRGFVTGDAKKLLDDAFARNAERPKAVRWKPSPLLALSALAAGICAATILFVKRYRRLHAAK